MNIDKFPPSYKTEIQSVGYVIEKLEARGFEVKVTERNSSKVDLFATNSSGKTYMIDVKGQRNKRCWIIKNPNSSPDFYYILVYLPKNKPIRSFIIPGTGVRPIWEEIKSNREMKQGRQLDVKLYPNDIPFRSAYPWENRWDLLT